MSATTVILWVGAAIMTIGLLSFLYLTLKAPPENRAFFTATSLVALIAATSYFAMATGHGNVAIGGRVFFFARYVDWVFTTPLLLLDLSLLALPTIRENTARVATLIGADIYMIITGLVAGLLNDPTKYVWFATSLIAFFVVLYILVGDLFVRARERGGDVARLFSTLSILTVVLWLCYPVLWLIGTEGFAVVPLSVEVGLFAVLDVLAKVGFGFILLTSSVVMSGRAARRSSVYPA